MALGIQYDLTTGFITGACQPEIDTSQQQMPDGRGQLVVDPSTNFQGMVVDLTANPLALIAAPPDGD